MGQDWKGKGSPALYIAGMGLSLVNPLLGIAVYSVVAAIWLIPDRRVERFIAAHVSPEAPSCHGAAHCRTRWSQRGAQEPQIEPGRALPRGPHSRGACPGTS